MTKPQDLKKLANEYIDQVVKDQQALGYASKVSEGARAEAVEHALVALDELVRGSHARDSVAA